MDELPHDEQIYFDENTPIVQQITLADLYTYLRKLTPRELIIQRGRDFLDKIERLKRKGRSWEIQIEILQMDDIDRFLHSLVTIAGDDYRPGIHALDRLILDFQNTLLRGINVIVSRRFGEIPEGLTRAGLIQFMNYILTDDEVGMRRLIGTHILAQNPQWSFARCVYLVTRFLNSFNRFGNRVAEIIIGSFTLGYFNFCVGGYDHTLSTWIAANGRPQGDNYFSARDGAGLADCILYGLKYGISIMIRKLRELLPDNNMDDIHRRTDIDSDVGEGMDEGGLLPRPRPVPPPRPPASHIRRRAITTTADITKLRNLISQHERALGEVERNRNNDTIAEESRLARAIAQFFPVWNQSIQYTPEVIQATNGQIGRFYTQYRAWAYTNKSFDGFKIVLIDAALKLCPDREEDIAPLNADLQRFANSIYGPHFMGDSLLEAWDLENPVTYNNAPSEGGKYNKSKNRLSKRNNNKKSKKCLSKRINKTTLRYYKK